MRQLTLINRVAQKEAAVELCQNDDLRGELVVPPSGQTLVPMASSYSIYAVASLPDGGLRASPTETILAASQTVRAQLEKKPGAYELRLILAAGRRSDELLLVNPTLAKVEFHVFRNGTPLKGLRVVDPLESAVVRTGNAFTVRATIDGVLTPAVISTDAQTTLEIEHTEDGYTLRPAAP